ncbi:MAG: heavy-metal-associated domain-containing protein [Alphaproteobacteria bacterium]|nr:heavy-metal-associated domain-containing protein [Alphaproteobacteria bacterium]MCB9792172.1 heavy-metal-associated domain-containing protein [Alphaproteobacteria bacterium]
MSSQRLTLPVVGMSCGGCVSSVQRALGAVDGVLQVVEVRLDPGDATIEFDPSRTERAALVSAIEDAGFDVPA